MQTMQMYRSEKIADACNDQIFKFTTNNDKHHFLWKDKDFNAQILTKILLPSNESQTYSQIYILTIWSPKCT